VQARSRSLEVIAPRSRRGIDLEAPTGTIPGRAQFSR
jgi:hypothetical protein